MLFSERPPTYASCMTISGERTEQHVIRFSAASLALQDFLGQNTRTTQHVIMVLKSWLQSTRIRRHFLSSQYINGIINI